MKARSIIDAVEGVTKKWAKQRKAEERATAARANRRFVMLRTRAPTQIEAAERVLPAAWAKASGNGKYPASARQIYYAARQPMQDITGRPINYGYFSQTLLPDYIEQHGLDWDVVYDARGTYVEPHSRAPVPLGTLQVRQYLAQVVGAVEVPAIPHVVVNRRFPTIGPKNRYGGLLFIEKEGFTPLLDAAQFAARFDLAIMSTKGMSVTAARRLIETLCGDHGIPLLTLHDFDISGFTIAGTLRESTRRYHFKKGFRVIDLGLRLDDVAGLEREDVVFGAREDLDAKAATLRRYGATPDEIAFLLDGRQRVELNALTSPAFVAFLERKLAANGIGKVVPDRQTLALAGQRAAMLAEMQKAIDAVAETAAETTLPEDLEARLRRRLAERPELPWDIALLELLEGDLDPEPPPGKLRRAKLIRR